MSTPMGNPPTKNEPSGPPRRRFLRSGLLTAAAGLLGGRAEKGEAKAGAATKPAAGNGGKKSLLRKSGEWLTSRMRQGEPPVQPLDTMLLFERGDDNNGRAMTHEVLSLIHQEKGKKSFPWTMYASLETHHEEGDACVVCSRLHKHGPGWSSGLHSEVFSHGRAVALGVNVEMSNDYAGPETTNVIGVNVQAVKGPRPMQYGMQIHDSEGRFEKGIGLNGTGEVGVDMAGRFGVGLHTHDNDIVLNEGACIALDGKGAIRVRYRQGRIEFLNGDRRFGHLDVNGEDHAL